MDPKPSVQRLLHRVSLYISYARKDKALKERLEEHLSILRYRGLINLWQAGEVSEGDAWEREIGAQMEHASIILLLISASFLSSRYWYSVEMRQALERYQRGTAHIVPILLRPVVLTDVPFAQLRALPSNGKSITTWRNRDSAFVDVALGIEQMLLAPEQSEGPGSFIRQLLESAPSIVASARRKPLIPFLALIRHLRGDQGRSEQAYYKEALNACNAALAREPADAQALRGLGIALEGLKRYEQALQAFRRQATLTTDALPVIRAGDILLKLKRPQEARQAYEEALARDSQQASAAYGLGQALRRLGLTCEAEQAFDQARQNGYGED